MVQGNGYFSSRMVQDCIHAELTNGEFCCKEYNPCMNSMVNIDFIADLRDMVL